MGSPGNLENLRVRLLSPLCFRAQRHLPQFIYGVEARFSLLSSLRWFPPPPTDASATTKGQAQRLALFVCMPVWGHTF